MNNKISSLVLPAKLATLNVSNNKLTFETLPSTSIATNYTYNNQKPMVVTAAEGGQVTFVTGNGGQCRDRVRLDFRN